MVLHYAHLAKAAGGVTGFVIGTELRGLTWSRSGPGTYPFVDALITLAADVKAVLGPSTKVIYAADWSEYFGHQPQDGSGDVYFHLDPLWASASIDAIGMDQYWPLADWREGTTHADYVAGTRSIYDLAYLKSNVQGGEGFDWYYASGADRDAQIRSPITDGQGKPWIFRFKDIKSWWLNPHYNRPGGVESATPTAWVPQSKPFWFMEIGCPAVDKGANQPNVFVDPKSSESALPYYARGVRDDLMQRRFLGALIETFDPLAEDYVPGTNPTSSVYGGLMVDLSRIHIYAWDARPYPAFPFAIDVWSDGENWHLGHWLNGRFASAPLSETVSQILEDFGFTEYETGSINGIVPGYVIDRVMSARDALQPLELAYFFDSLESAGKIQFRQRGLEAPAAAFAEDQFVESKPQDALMTLTRGQETDLPQSAKISYISNAGDFMQAVAEARRLAGASGRVSQAELAIVLEPEQAGQIAESWLHEAWSARERASFRLPPTSIHLEPGDTVLVSRENSDRLYRLIEIGEHGAREVEARAIDPEIYGGIAVPARVPATGAGSSVGASLLEFLDLPLLRGDEPPEAGYVAASQSPWPGGVAIYGSPEATGFRLRAVATVPATIGVTLTSFSAGPLGVFDYANRLQVEISGGELTSASKLQVFAGANTAAVRNEAGEWEVIQFTTATLLAPRTYEISGLLRGQAGTEAAMRSPLAAGARVVFLNAAHVSLNLAPAEIKLPLNWRYGPSSRDIGDISYTSAVHAFQGVGLRPLSPVHLSGARNGGDLTISWIRRTRIGGDSWDTEDVPLSEASEAYDVDILDGTTVKRTLSVTSASALYTAAQQTADFGAPQTQVSVMVYQKSAAYGRGSARAATL
jgi:hypothetical protein